jgi:hypothetical protein
MSYDHELHECLSKGPQPGQSNRGDEKDDDCPSSLGGLQKPSASGLANDSY